MFSRLALRTVSAVKQQSKLTSFDPAISTVTTHNLNRTFITKSAPLLARQEDEDEERALPTAKEILKSLAKSIRNEISDEADAGPIPQTADQELFDYVTKDLKFKISNDHATGVTTMTREIDEGKGYDVKVTFGCQSVHGSDIPMMEGEDGSEMSDEEMAERYAESEDGGITFDLEVIPKKAGELCMIMEITASSDGSVDIQSLRLGAPGSKSINEVNYNGPTLEELDEELQQNLSDFVEGVVCVDGDVIAFMMMEADRIEQGSYVKWLEGVKKILE